MGTTVYSFKLLQRLPTTQHIYIKKCNPVQCPSYLFQTQIESGEKEDKQLTDRVAFSTQSTMRPFSSFFYLLRFGSVRSYENTNNILYILSPKKFDIPTVHKI